jgi:hypothetical protein
MGWSIDDGVLTNAHVGDALPIQPVGGVNPGSAADRQQPGLQTEVHGLGSRREYKVATDSNSGIYLRGQVRQQIPDDATATGGRRTSATWRSTAARRRW